MKKALLLVIMVGAVIASGCATIERGRADHYRVAFGEALTSGVVAFRAGHFAEARDAIEQARNVAEREYGDESQQAITCQVWLARTSDGMEDAARARSLYEAAAVRLRSRDARMIAEGSQPNFDLAVLYEERAEWESRHQGADSARAFRQEAHMRWEAAFGAEVKRVAKGLEQMAQQYARLGMAEECSLLSRRAKEYASAESGPN
jgi:hypothetical protein